MTKDEELKFLVKHLRTVSGERKQEPKKYRDSYTKGFSSGESIAFELCANWIEEIISK